MIWDRDHHILCANMPTLHDHARKNMVDRLSDDVIMSKNMSKFDNW